MPKFEDLSGQRFGRLIALEFEARKKKSWWLCQCDCGNQKWIRKDMLKDNRTKSCGCLISERNHGWFGTSLYNRWNTMIQRCHNPNSTGYPKYGARGIMVCERWRSSFLNFLDDMGEPPPGTSIDRIDGDGNYEPSNCRWATISEQNLNRKFR